MALQPPDHGLATGGQRRRTRRVFVAQWNGFIRAAALDAEVSPLPLP